MKNKLTHNRRAIRKARAASSILKDRRTEIEKALIEAQKKEIQKQKNTIKSKAPAKALRVSQGVLRYAAVLVICFALAVSLLVGYSVSWFMMSKEAPGASIFTGHISLNMSTYKAGTSADLDRFVDSDVTGTDSIEVYNGLQHEIGIFADSSGQIDDVYFVITKNSDSTPLETYLSFTLEGAEGSGAVSDYAGGFYFQLENVTDAVSSATAISTTVLNRLTDETVDDASVSTVEKKLHSYIDSNQANKALAKAMTSIGDDCGNNTAKDLINGNICVYRLTTFMSDEARKAGQYQNVEFTLRVSLRAGQEGSISGGTSSVYTVSSMSEMNEALSRINPGDSIICSSAFTYNGDLIITAPVTLDLGGYALNVNGNLVLTSSYSGDFIINTAVAGSSLTVNKVGNVGGKFSADIPGCTLTLNGQNDEHTADIAIEGDITLNCSAPSATDYDTTATDTGLTVDGSRICTVDSTGVHVSVLHGLTVRNNTRVNVCENTHVGIITADTDTEVDIISIVNRGTVDGIDFSSVKTVYNSSENEYCALHCPQIFIDNFGTVSSAIVLPLTSTKYLVSSFTGNTRIIREFDAEDSGVTGSYYFSDEDIETVENNVIDVYGDGTTLRVYYTDLNKKDDIDIDIRTIFAGSGTYNGYFKNSKFGISVIKSIEIITGSDKTMTADDYSYIRETFSSSLVTLDLGEAKTGGSGIPDNAFRQMAMLSSLTLPSDTTEIGLNIVEGTKVYDLYLPASVETVSSTACLNGVKYIHDLDTETGLYNLTAKGLGRYIFTSAASLTNYRNMYQTELPYIFKEATLSKNGLFFYRKLNATSMNVAVWVGPTSDTSGISLASMNADGSYYYVAGIDDYAFYGKIITTETELSCSSRLASIGEYAFGGCTALKAVNFESESLVSIGYRAFDSCTSLKTVTINAVSGRNLVLKDQSSYKADVPIGLFSGCSSLSSLTLKHISEITQYTLCADVKINDQEYERELLPLQYLCIEYADSIENLAFCIYEKTDKTYSGSETLVSVYINEVNTCGNYLFTNSPNLLTAIIKKTDTLGTHMFEGCEKLVAVSATDTTTIGVNFCTGCESLEVAALPLLNNVSEVSSTALPNTFDGCNSLVYLDTGIPSVSKCGTFIESNLSLNTWVIHSENYESQTTGQYSQNVYPDGFLPTSISGNGLVFVPSRMYNNTSLDNKISTGVLTASDLIWVDHTDEGAERWTVSTAIDGVERAYHLSDFGMGDYLISRTGSVTTVYRCLLVSINGDTTMPDVATNGGSTTIGEKAFQYLSATDTTSTTSEKTVFRMPESVTRIEYRAFYSSNILGVEGLGVTFLGEASFMNCGSLRWAKFPKCCELGISSSRTSTINTSTTNRSVYDVATFAYCPKLAVVELSLIDAANYSHITGTHYFIGLFYNCTDLKEVIVHTEYDGDGLTQDSLIYSYAFYVPYGSPTVRMSTTLTDFHYILSAKSNSGIDYNCTPHWTQKTIENKTIISTGDVRADCYKFAGDSNTSCVTAYTLEDGWRLADIGYGDYLCVAESSTSAKLVMPLFKYTYLYSSSGYVYETPNVTTDGLPIVTIGENAYKNIQFMSDCTSLVISDNTKVIESSAFAGSAWNSNYSSKSIQTVNLNQVETVMYCAFAGISNLDKVSAGANIRDLGNCTFANSSSALKTIELRSENEVAAENLFGGATPSADLRVKVYSDIYVSYYRDLGYWGGPTSGASASNAVSTLDSGNAAHFETIGNVWVTDHANIYYADYHDNITGTDGYKITSIVITASAQSILYIPTAWNDSNDELKPVLAIASSAFSDSSLQGSKITTVYLPKYLQSIELEAFSNIWQNLEAYRITSDDCGLSLDIENSFSVDGDGLLYSADGSTLVSCPPGITGEHSTDENSKISFIAPYAFAGTKLTGISIRTCSDSVYVSRNAFVSNDETLYVRFYTKTIFSESSFKDMDNLVCMYLFDTSSTSQFLGEIFENVSNDAKIYIPQGKLDDYSKTLFYNTELRSRLFEMSDN